MSREHRIPIMFSADELSAIDEHRFSNRISSRAAAVRGLCFAGLFSMSALKDTRSALEQAESFISGFEDDDIQEGVTELLAALRAAVAALEQPQAEPSTA